MRTLWALISDGNDRGKSTIIRLILGALRGDWPDHIKDDVWKWLSTLTVDFSIDSVKYRASLSKTTGVENRVDAQVALARISDGQALLIYEGAPGKAFEAATNEIFQEELGFAEVKAFNQESGADTTHGWQSMAAALYINGPGKAIFGDVTMGGMPLRLLQLFMGLPWISTYTQALTAQKSLAHRLSQSQTPSAFAARYDQRLASLEIRLAAAKAKVQDTQRRPILRKRLAELDVMLVRSQGELTEARQQADDLKDRHAAATADLMEAKRTLQQLKDEQAAGLIFRKLRPVCCPSCESGIDEIRYETSGAHICALCGTEQAEDGTETSHLTGITADINDLHKEVARLAANLRKADDLVHKHNEAKSKVASEAALIGKELAVPADNAWELEIASIEAQIAQLRELISDEQSPSVSLNADEKVVIDAAVLVTANLFKDLQSEILEELSSSVTRLTQRFGVQNLSSIEITSGGATKVQQGGAKTSFSRMNGGEKLRIRIAAALAVIEVARGRQYGRHPGLLLLDSPAAQEMNSEDFGELIGSVRNVVDAAGDIQIIVGAVAQSQLLKAVPSEHIKYAKRYEFLF